MSLRTCLMGGILLSLAVAVIAIADDSTTKPSQLEERTSTRNRIVAPFNLLTDLSDAQKSQIADIHKAELDQERALRQKEHDDILAVLTDAQKTELDAAIAKSTAERRAASEERRAKTEEDKAQQLRQQAGDMGSATTQPSGN